MAARAPGPARPVLVLLAAAALALFASAAVAVARLSPALGEERHRIGILTVDDLHEGQAETAAAMVLTLIAAVLWGRVRRLPTRRHLLLFTALCMLALDNAVSALLTGGYDSLSADRFATWASTVNGLVGVALLMVAAWLPDRPLRWRRHLSTLAVVAVAGTAAASMATVWVLAGVLPDAFAAPPERPADVTFLGSHPSLTVVEVLSTVAWTVSAVLFARLAQRSSDELTWWLALFSTLAAASSLNYALFPSHITELLYLGDYFFLVAVTALLVGSIREVGAAEASLVDGALYRERRRIAQEMHDGVAQELAIVSSQAHRIRAHPESSESALGTLEAAVGRALDEARTAIRQLAGPVDEPLSRLIGATALGITQRAGVRLVLDLDEDVEVPTAVGAALVHVTREAVGAAVRTAGAQEVTVRLHQSGPTVLAISHDGRGRGLARALDTALTSIRERVERLPGRLDVVDLPEGGLALEVSVP